MPAKVKLPAPFTYGPFPPPPPVKGLTTPMKPIKATFPAPKAPKAPVFKAPKMVVQKDPKPVIVKPPKMTVQIPREVNEEPVPVKIVNVSPAPRAIPKPPTF